MKKMQHTFYEIKTSAIPPIETATKGSSLLEKKYAKRNKKMQLIFKKAHYQIIYLLVLCECNYKLVF